MTFLKNLSIIVLLMSLTSVHAQWVPGGNSDHNEEVINEYFKGIRKNIDPNDNIKGSPYLNEDFQNAVLIFPKGDPLAARVRYDVTKEEMQVQIDKDGYRILHPGVIVKLNNKPYQMLSYRGDEKTVDLIGYFEIVTPNIEGEDDVKLLRKHKKTVRRGKAAAAMQKATPARYVDKDDYYLQFGKMNPVQVERSTKKFVSIFPEEHQEAVKEFMKENKLNSKYEQDLRSIVNYYNSIF